ncbi:GHKL domain-containing protein [Holzapfeliella sp. He02]|uniref:GHKL domain-containing protein n=1 Tax=Holzapfeliella saturejae TaxID=3082953 RepID=A0ABU8SG22_9LACO
MLYLYVVTRAAIFISGYFGVFATTITIINIILIVQAVFTVIVFLITSHNQQKKYDFKLLKKQFDTLNDYTAELEHSQEVNAKFKHDYKNLLLSLKGSVESDNSSELINTVSDLEQYSDNYFKKIEVDFRHCQNIKNDYLKSLIISKLSKAKQKEIACHFECEMVVDKMPIDQFDCVRMFGIVLDNAIEAAVETAHPRIDIMLYQDDHQLEFWVRNNYVANTVDLKSLRQANVSTKAGHSGLGLVNIEEISQKHPNILKTFSKKKDIFSANIKILVN